MQLWLLNFHSLFVLEVHLENLAAQPLKKKTQNWKLLFLQDWLMLVLKNYMQFSTSWCCSGSVWDWNPNASRKMFIHLGLCWIPCWFTTICGCVGVNLCVFGMQEFLFDTPEAAVILFGKQKNVESNFPSITSGAWKATNNLHGTCQNKMYT